MLSDAAAEAARTARSLVSRKQFTKLRQRCPGAQEPGVLEGYLDFLALKMGAHDYYDCLLSPPSPEIELVWREHILDTMHYTETCARLGVPASVRILNHNPPLSSGADRQEERQECARAFYGKAFGVPSCGIWAPPLALERTASETPPDPPSPAPLLPAMPAQAPKRQRVADAVAASPAGAAEPTPKAEAAMPPAPGKILEIRIQNHSDGTHVLFKLNEYTPLERMMAAYCKRVQVGRHERRFTFDGMSVGADMTPVSLGMEDGDVVDVHPSGTPASNSPL
jgi:small ubiquitin-related modifier